MTKVVKLLPLLNLVGLIWCIIQIRAISRRLARHHHPVLIELRKPATGRAKLEWDRIQEEYTRGLKSEGLRSEHTPIQS